MKWQIFAAIVGPGLIASAYLFLKRYRSAGNGGRRRPETTGASKRAHDELNPETLAETPEPLPGVGHLDLS